MSGSGPASLLIQGVWQSLQPATVTRYLPRATCALFAASSLACALLSMSSPSRTARVASGGLVQDEVFMRRVSGEL